MVGESKPPPCLCLPRRCPRTLSARVPAVLGEWDGLGEPAEGLGAPCSISCIGTAEQAGGKRAVPVRGCTSRGRRPRGTPPGHPSASWWSLGETKTLHFCTLESCAGIQNIAMSMISPLGIAQGWQSHVCRREGFHSCTQHQLLLQQPLRSHRQARCSHPLLAERVSLAKL